MAAKETTVFPVKGRSLAGVPAAVHVVPSKAEADALVASGAFTFKKSEGDPDAPDLSGDGPFTHESVVFHGEAPPGDEPANDSGPANAGPSDSTEE